MGDATRGMLQAVAVGLGLAAMGGAIVWGRRRVLRRWHLVAPLVVLVLTTPPALRMIHDLRTHAGGDGAAWGRMGELIILLGLVPVICMAVGALATGMIALSVYGLATPAALAAEKRVPWHARLTQPRSEQEIRMRLYVSLGSLIVVGVLWLLGVRPGG